jgi:hypothetical protein
MAFMQIIEFRTTDIDRARRVNDEWWRATEGKRTVRRELLAHDRSDPSRFFAVVFFDSFESAMENSDLPETQASTGLECGGGRVSGEASGSGTAAGPRVRPSGGSRLRC